MITELRISGYPVDTKFLKLRGQGAFKIDKGPYGPVMDYTLVSDVSDSSQSVAPITPIVTGSYVRSINYTSPLQTGQFMLFGDYCTSVVQHTDNSDPMSTADSNTINIFDGCKSCTDCQTQWYTQSMLQECLLWLAGLKDCVLHYQPAAARLWKQMLNKRTLEIQGCGKSDIDDQSYRQRQFGKAVKLLYQYKAAVAMWNYLVFTKARSLQVVQAPQSHLGFIVQSKRIIDFCDADISQVKLYITATLQSGQTNQFLSTQGRIMLVYAGKVDQNTYIQYGKDTASLGGGLDTDNVSSNISADMQPQVNCVLTFNPTRECRAVFSGSLKVLPVICQGAYNQDYQPPSTTLIDIQEYAAAAYDACDIDLGQLTSTNRWCISLAWQFTVGDMTATRQDTEQVTYYTSGFGLYPTRSDSQSYTGTSGGGDGDNTGGSGDDVLTKP